MKSNLKDIRNKLGLSLQELGDMCGGISKAQMHMLESEKANPTITTAYKLAVVLQKPVTSIWPNTMKIVEETITVRRIKLAK